MAMRVSQKSSLTASGTITGGALTTTGTVSGGNGTFTGTLSAAGLGSWSSLSFGTGWGNYGGGYAACEYRKFGDLVMVRGLALLSSGTGATIGTLPSGYRPTSGTIINVLATSGGYQRVDVTTAGAINVVGGATTSMWVAINFVFSLS